MFLTGVVLGVGIWFVGALVFWIVFYRILGVGFVEKVNERKQEME